MIDLQCVRGLAKTHQTGLGFVHARHSDSSKELGQPVALWLVEKLADRCDVTLEEVLKKLSGICISRAIENGMVFNFNMTTALIIEIKGIPAFRCYPWIGELEEAHWAGTVLLG